MRISHSQALSLENTVRAIYNHCERSEFYGLINADYFEHDPFAAVLIAFSPIHYSGKTSEDIGEFIDKYRFAFDHPEEYGMTEEAIDSFCSELWELAKKHYNL